MPGDNIPTVTFDDFGNGIDRRVGRVSRSADKFFELENYVVTSGRKLKRRPPMRNLTGLLDPSTQFCRYINGKVVTVAPAGTTVSHTIGSGLSIETLYFDMPEKALATYELLDMAIFNDQLVALIRHDFDSGVAPKRIFLHVWDDTHPTYVTDPACPTSWGPEYPLHASGKGKLGGYSEYTPHLAISADRIYLSRPDGNVGFCGAGSPRIWNTRTTEEMLSDGRWWYWINTNSPGDQVVTLPVPFYDLKIDQRYAAYVLEYCGSDGRWAQLREQTIMSAYEDYKIDPVANRWDALGQPELQLTYRLPGDGMVMRFRVFAKPPTVIQTGLYITPDATVVGGVLSHAGDGQVIGTYQLVTPLDASEDYYISVPIPGAPIPVPAQAIGGPGSMPFNGQERYWMRILASAVTNVTGLSLLYALTGTVTTTVGGTRVTGLASLFRSELEIGRQVEINGERRIVRFIGSDTDFEVDAPFSSAYVGTGLRDPRYRYAYEIGDTGNEWYSELEAKITFSEAGSGDAGYLGTAIYDSTGELPLTIATLQNRLLVQFPSTLQAWSVGSTLEKFALLSVDGQSSGKNTSPQPALIDGMSALPTVNGVRLFSPSGNNKDYIDFIGVGDMLRGVELPDLSRAIWWPLMRTYLTCQRVSSTDLVFYCLTRHQDSKVLAWSFWKFAGLTSVDSMFIAGDDLVIQSGRRLYRVTALDTTFRDDNDPADAPYESRARWIYCDLGNPSKNKKIVRCELVQEGTCSVAIYMNPYVLNEKVAGPPTVKGQTMGRQRVAMGVMGPGIGLEISSRDPAGHELDSVGFDYKLLNR